MEYNIEDRLKELRKMCTISLTDSNYTDKVEVLLNDYEYIEENGKAFFVKKKTDYPKTYEECIGKLPINWDNKVEGYKSEMLDSFQKLIICRDVYWTMAGEEMGLQGPWEPDWNDEKQDKYGFYNEVKYIIINSAIFVFPTPEMRDVFYDNFKKEIEICKELL